MPIAGPAGARVLVAVALVGRHAGSGRRWQVEAAAGAGVVELDEGAVFVLRHQRVVGREEDVGAVVR